MLVILAIILLFFAWSVWGFLGKMTETRKNRIIAEEKIAELQKEKDKLSSGISKLNTEKGQEEIIREKFGLEKDGEGSIVIVDNQNGVDAKNKANQGGFFSFFKNWFK